MISKGRKGWMEKNQNSDSKVASALVKENTIDGQLGIVLSSIIDCAPYPFVNQVSGGKKVILWQLQLTLAKISRFH
jgi:hypothetical protein